MPVDEATRSTDRGSRTTRRPDATSDTPSESTPSDRLPRGGFAALVGIYSAGVAGAAWFAKRRGLPDHVSPWDLVLIGVATHKLSRRLSKDSVTSPFRAPFAEFREPAGSGEINEEVKGHGLKKAVGELVTCPFCIGQWVATGLVFGLVFAPRATRLTASVFASAAIADFLQLAYARAEQAADEG
jgi:hypothetical protein